MKGKKVKIKKMVPLDIFENKEVKERIDFLFNDLDSSIRCRFSEIREFVLKYVKREYLTISYDNALNTFKLYLYKQVLNEAVETVFSQNTEYDIRKIIINIITEERINKAIYGEPMTYTFADFIRNLPDGAFIEGNKKEDVRIAVERRFSPNANSKKYFEKN